MESDNKLINLFEKLKNYNHIVFGKLADLFPRYKSIKVEDERLREILKDMDRAPSNISTSEKIKILNQEARKIKVDVQKIGLVKEKELFKNIENIDIDFLKCSMESWDKADFAILFICISVGVLLNNLPESKLEKIHKDHSTNVNNNSSILKKLFNHDHMPSDTIPKNYDGIDAATGEYIPTLKINGIPLNHRYVYGHDWLKIWEVFKDVDKIPDNKCVGGIVGKVVKQLAHMFFDTFSKTGIPSPGSTYFAQYLVENNAEFMKYFSVHFSDIAAKDAIDAILFIYSRYREYKRKGLRLDDLLKPKYLFDIDLHHRTIKEYEMAMFVHGITIIIVTQVSSIGGNLNHKCLQAFTRSLVQYVRINNLWDKEYKKAIIRKLQELDNPLINREYCEVVYEFTKQHNIAFYGIQDIEVWDRISDKYREFVKISKRLEELNASEPTNFNDEDKQFLTNVLTEYKDVIIETYGFDIFSKLQGDVA